MARQTRTPKAAVTAASQIYVNLPVKDLKKSITYFTALGFTFIGMTRQGRDFQPIATGTATGRLLHVTGMAHSIVGDSG
jgi:catechol 2,3-dioxygenase-like lactoylglutathione lyase family enzyme